MSILGIGGLIGGVLAILFGILIFIFPRILNYLVAIYFLVIGIIMLVGALT